MSIHAGGLRWEGRGGGAAALELGSREQPEGLADGDRAAEEHRPGVFRLLVDGEAQVEMGVLGGRAGHFGGVYGSGAPAARPDRVGQLI